MNDKHYIRNYFKVVGKIVGNTLTIAILASIISFFAFKNYFDFVLWVSAAVLFIMLPLLVASFFAVLIVDVNASEKKKNWQKTIVGGILALVGLVLARLAAIPCVGLGWNDSLTAKILNQVIIGFMVASVIATLIELVGCGKTALREKIEGTNLSYYKLKLNSGVFYLTELQVLISSIFVASLFFPATYFIKFHVTPMYCALGLIAAVLSVLIVIALFKGISILIQYRHLQVFNLAANGNNQSDIHTQEQPHNVIEQTLTRFGDSATELSKVNISRIKTGFPVPVEQRILWADVEFGRRISGLVLTDKGIFIKGNKAVIAQNNATVMEKKDKVNTVFHYLRWEFFSAEDFRYEDSGNEAKIYFCEKLVLTCNAKRNFFKIYSETYADIIKEAAVSAENILADFEAVVPENFARINTKTGHGEMAEEALTLLDKLEGKDSTVLGRDNVKDGPDRIVNGQLIQTKYYQTGRKSVDACFDKETGIFRYRLKNGNLMMVEVAKDQYAEAINEFRKKILEGKVPGVTNPDDASKYIKQGKLTYKQALNLCKPGTIESIAYDSLTGAVNCSFAFGLTFLSTFIMCYAQTGDRREAMSSAVSAGIQVFGLSFFAHLFTQQVARTTLTKQLIPLSSYIVNVMGYKAAQTIVNAIRAVMGKGAISGAAAMKQLAKILRSNVVTSAITFVVFSVPDTYNIFRRRISTAQYTKNMLSLIGTMVAAGGGTLGASLLATKIGAATGTAIAPGIGTAIGIAGGLVGGFVGGVVVKNAGDAIREDDTVVLSRLFNAVLINLVYEYMLSESEIDVVVEKLDKVKQKDFRNLYKDTLASKEQEKVMDDFLRRYFEEVIRTRPKIAEPNVRDLIAFAESLNEGHA